MSDAFAQLSPALRHNIVNSLGFSALRPVQKESVPPIMAGENCIVLAPTAGGKTEAAFFPILSKMDTEDWRPVSVLYVAPIVALLNNQEDRLRRYTQFIGRTSFKWHGGVSAADRKKFIVEPTDVLLTTPESLEVMLMSQKVPASRLFAGLQAVIIDEIHAFVGDDRGGHLSAVLERLSRFCQRDIQRIGLSATVGNPPEILSWVAGSSKRPGRVIRPPADPVKPDLKLDYVGSLENAATIISKLHRGEKRLVFVDSRRQVEMLGTSLRGLGVDAFVTHSSLSKEQRAMAEKAFEEGSDCVIVATSALELGIDIGSLDRVIQIDAPFSVASFLQRMGRTGRRAEKPIPNCLFLATKVDALVRAAALLRLHEHGFVEDVPLRRHCYHLLAHQLMTLSVQQRGIPVSDWWSWLSDATPFQAIDSESRDALISNMLSEDILVEVGGRLSLGERGQKLYGRHNFMELYTVFSAPKTLRVLYGREEIGAIDAYFAQTARVDELAFSLGAQIWRGKAIDWSRGVLWVQPDKHGSAPRWIGQARLMERSLCQAIREVLVGSDMPEYWSERARKYIEGERHGSEILVEDTDGLASTGDGFELHTFAGGKANNLLAFCLRLELGDKITADNLKISLRDEAGKSASEIRLALRKLREEDRPNYTDAIAFAAKAERGELSKFEACLPNVLVNRFLAEALCVWGSSQ